MKKSITISDFRNNLKKELNSINEEDDPLS